MGNPGYNNDENKWVEERIAQLSPPAGWRPDTDKAFESVLQRTTSTAVRPVVRLSMAGVTLAVITIVVVLLPWKALWKLESRQPITVQTQAVKPAQTTPENISAGQVSPPAPQPPVAPPQRDPREQSSEEPKQNAPAPPPDAQAVPPLQRKKEPRPIIAGREPQQNTVPSIAQAQAPTGGVSEPVVVYKVQPGYTPEAKEARIQGIVIISATVREDGTVKVERIVQSLGYGLDEAAAAALEQWKFIPGKKDGQPVAVTVHIQFQFGLK